LPPFIDNFYYQNLIEKTFTREEIRNCLIYSPAELLSMIKECDELITSFDEKFFNTKKCPAETYLKYKYEINFYFFDFDVLNYNFSNSEINALRYFFLCRIKVLDIQNLYLEEFFN